MITKPKVFWQAISAVQVYVLHCHTSVSMLYMCFNAIYVFQLETHIWHWHTCMAFKHFVCYWKHTCIGKYVQHWNTCMALKHCMPMNMYLALEQLYSESVYLFYVWEIRNKLPPTPSSVTHVLIIENTIILPF
jgi:hypothetical protein